MTLTQRLQSVADQAKLAMRLKADDDNLLDVVDMIDRDVQAVIELLQARRSADVTAGETAGGETAFRVEAILIVHPESDENIQTEQRIRDEVTSWLEGLGATVRSVAVIPIEDQARSEEGT